MMTQQRPGFGGRIQRPLQRGAALVGIAWALAACGGSAGLNEEPRYPEKRRPATLRSASDGEVMGANGQSPEDTLEGSPTNLHPAPGWEGEKGGTERAREVDCDPEAKEKNASADAAETKVSATNANTASGRLPAKKPCPKGAGR